MTARALRVRLAAAAAVLICAAACSSGGIQNADGDAGQEPSSTVDGASETSAAADGDDSVDEDVTAEDGTTTEVRSSLATGEPGGPGELVDATVEAGLDETLRGIRGHAVATADVNDDGWDDLFVGTFADRPLDTYAVRGAEGPAPDRLLLGSPSGFELDPEFEGRLGRSAGAVFDDLDNDGDPDLVVSRNVRDSERGRAPSEIYRNDEGKLVAHAVLDDERGGRAIGIVDFDQDGLHDIVLVEDRWSGSKTGLFHNDGDLSFSEVTNEVGFPDDVFGLGVGVGDLDGDGIDDLVVGGSNRWFLGNGEGFVEGASSPLPWELHGDEDDPAHVVLVDANDDGMLDIFVGQHFKSTIDDGIAEPVRLFLNQGSDGDGQPRFDDVTESVGLPGLTTKSPQILLVDLDGNGWEDLITSASYGEGDDDRLPVVVDNVGVDDALPSFDAPTVSSGLHYWIDAVTLDANGDGRTDLFFVEWEPALGSRLFLNMPADRE